MDGFKISWIKFGSGKIINQNPPDMDHLKPETETDPYQPKTYTYIKLCVYYLSRWSSSINN